MENILLQDKESELPSIKLIDFGTTTKMKDMGTDDAFAEEITKVFEKHDDGDKKLSVDELKKAMEELELHPTDAEIEEFKNEFDEDRSGYFSLEEFKKVCSNMKSLNNKNLKEQVGTIMYMAPEVVKKEDYCTKSDCWSIGVIAFALLTGELPFHIKDVRLSEKEATQNLMS